MTPNKYLQPPTMNIAAPINDAQLIGLMAVHLEGEPRERAELAADILAEAVIATNSLPARIRQKQSLRAEVN